MLLANRFASTQGIVLEWICQFYERILTLRASHVTQPLSARAAFPKGNRSMTMRDVLGILYSDAPCVDRYQQLPQNVRRTGVADSDHSNDCMGVASGGDDASHCANAAGTPTTARTMCGSAVGL